MNDRERNQRTEQYRQAVSRAWGKLRIGNKEDVLFTQVYILLQVIENPRAHLWEKQSDVVTTPERLDHVGIGSDNLRKPGTREGELKEDGQQLLPSLPVPKPLSLALAESRHLTLLGESGAGKSTTLQAIGLCFAGSQLAQDHLGLTKGPSDSVPVMVSLRAYSDALSKNSCSLVNILAQEVNSYLPWLGEEKATDLVTTWLEQDRLVVLLDGLDELTGSSHDNIRSLIQRFAASLIEKSISRVIVTSRLAGYSSLGSSFKDYTLKPFTGDDEIRPYLHNLLTALNVPDPEKQATHLYDELVTHPALNRLLDNPLILRLAAEVYSDNQTIAQNRSELYRLAIDEYWRRAEQRGASEKDKKVQVLEKLDTLAWRMQLGETLTLKEFPEESLSLEREKLGLFVLIGEKWVFSHATYQSYFVARHLAHAWRDLEKRDNLWDFLRTYLHHSIWREPLLLMGGLLETKELNDLIGCILKCTSQYERQLFRDLRLAAEIIGECSNLDENQKPVRKVISKLIKRLTPLSIQRIYFRGLSSLPWIRFSEWSSEEAVKALAAIGAPAISQLVQLFCRCRLSDYYFHIDLEERVPTLGPGQELLPIHRVGDAIKAIPKAALNMITAYEQILFFPAQSALVAIGEPSVKALKPMLQSASKVERLVSGATLIRIMENQGKNTIPDLVVLRQHQDPEIRERAVSALINLSDESIIPELLKRPLNSSYIQDSLSKIGVPAIPTLNSLIEEGDTECIQAVLILSNINDLLVIPSLIKALAYSSSGMVYQEARKAIIRFGEQAVPELLRILNDSNENEPNPDFILKRFGDFMGRPENVPMWQWNFQVKKDEFIKDILGEIGGQQAIPVLQQVIRDKRSGNASASAKALGKMGHVQSTTLILQMASGQFQVSETAKAAIKNIGSPAIPFVLNALQDEDWWVSLTAVQILGEIGNHEVIPHLLKKLDEITLKVEEFYDEPYILTYTKKDDIRRCNEARSDIVRAIGKIGDKEAVPCLLRLLDEPEHLELYREFEDGLYSREYPGLYPEILQTLGNIGDSQLIPIFSTILQNDSKCHHRQLAARALGKISDPKAASVLCDALKDEDLGVCKDAANALGKLGNRAAIQALAEFMQERTDQYSEAWWEAIEALAVLGDHQAFAVLEDEVNNWQPEAAKILARTGAVSVLLRIHGSDAVYLPFDTLNTMGIAALPGLVHGLQDPDLNVRQRAMKYLGYLGAAALDGLIGALANQDAIVREQAAELLYEISDPKSVPALLNGLLDSEPKVRVRSALALGKLGDRRSILALIKDWRYVCDLDEARQALEILGDLGDESALIHLLDKKQFDSYGIDNNVQYWEKIVPSVDNIPLLRRVASEQRQMRAWSGFEITVNRLTELEARHKSIEDPFNPLPQSKWQKVIRRFGWTSVTALLLGIAALLGVVLDILLDPLKDGTQPVFGQPLLLAFAVASLIAIITLLADSIRKKL